MKIEKFISDRIRKTLNELRFVDIKMRNDGVFDKYFKSDLNESVSSINNNNHIQYITDDNKAYANIIKISSDEWYISMIESERKGAGTELMNKIISDAKLSGVIKITLDTTEHSGWGFFDKLGFVEVGDNNDPWDVPMVLYL
jgi:hypothetical protein